jgi:biopolymer transport protein ExbB/TolQ
VENLSFWGLLSGKILCYIYFIMGMFAFVDKRKYSHYLNDTFQGFPKLQKVIKIHKKFSNKTMNEQSVNRGIFQHLSEIDPLASSRQSLSQAERVRAQKEREEREKLEGYQQLVELCVLGEYDAAKQLAQHHSNWGYQVIDGEVVTP